MPKILPSQISYDNWYMFLTYAQFHWIFVAIDRTTAAKPCPLFMVYSLTKNITSTRLKKFLWRDVLQRRWITVAVRWYSSVWGSWCHRHMWFCHARYALWSRTVNPTVLFCFLLFLDKSLDVIELSLLLRRTIYFFLHGEFFHCTEELLLTEWSKSNLGHLNWYFLKKFKLLFRNGGIYTLY